MTSSSVPLPARILKVYIRGLNGVRDVYHLHSLNNTLLFQGYVLENCSHCGNSGESAHAEHRGGGGEPLIAWVQRTGQLVVTSS